MSKTIAFLSAFVAPSLAMAHPGHEHVANATSHHLVEAIAVSGIAVLLFVVARARLQAQSARKDA